MVQCSFCYNSGNDDSHCTATVWNVQCCLFSASSFNGFVVCYTVVCISFADLKAQRWLIFIKQPNITSKQSNKFDHQAAICCENNWPSSENHLHLSAFQFDPSMKSTGPHLTISHFRSGFISDAINRILPRLAESQIATVTRNMYVCVKKRSNALNTHSHGLMSS